MTQLVNPFALPQIKNAFLKRLIGLISGIDVLEKIYDEWIDVRGESDKDIENFLDFGLAQLDVDAEIINAARLDDIPKDGAFIIVANHPLGGLEGMLLTRLLRRIRPDLKVLTNELLAMIPECADTFIGVDVLNTGRTRHNAKAMRQVSTHLAKGGTLLVFPAGTVSHMTLPSMTLSDAPWNSIISRLARHYKASIMPVFVGGRNSLLFYLSGYIHKRLRTLLLPRAMFEKAGQAIPLHFGAPIPAQDIQRLSDDRIAMQYIRMCCKVLGNASQEDDNTGDATPVMAVIKDDISTDIVVDHIQTLDRYRLYQQDHLSLYCAPYDALGPVMEQLSIERERTFRAVDEGTGKELDSDRFDPHYMHLFLWDETHHKIAGGYRLGETGRIRHLAGLDGLYSHSLFDYNEQFLDDMGNTIEVGRSFIAQDYQKNPIALDMLWKGIGRFVAAHPDYHTLFGCVSISRHYSKLVSAMLTETFISHYGVDVSIARHVKARTPVKAVKKPWTDDQIASLSAIPIINKLVGRIDEGKSIPTLIRHYLALNGRFISFTVNTGFNEALDGLIMVDLRKAPDRYLKRYMGEEGLRLFQSHHQTDEAA